MVGTDRRISLFDLAARAKEMKKRGEIPEDLDTKVTAETPLTFPNGCHIAEVEIDPSTGALALVAYAAVDDCGNALNTMIVEGQIHGSHCPGPGPGADGERGLSTPRAGSSSPARSWTMPCRALTTCRSFKEDHASGAGNNQSARRERARAKPAPRPRSPPS